MSNQLNRKQFPDKVAVEGMKHGDYREFAHPAHPDAMWRVNYSEHQPNGDNGKPARGYKKGVFEVEGPQGQYDSFRTAPFRPSKGEGYFQKNYSERVVQAHVQQSMINHSRQERVAASTKRLGNDDIYR